MAPASRLDCGLSGDILRFFADENTEHDQVYHYEGRISTFITGSILASSIREQMNSDERAYPNTNHDTITLVTWGTKFTATLTVLRMTLPSNLDANTIRLPTGSGFKVSDVQVNGRTVTVTFELSDPSLGLPLTSSALLTKPAQTVAE